MSTEPLISGNISCPPSFKSWASTSLSFARNPTEEALVKDAISSKLLSLKEANVDVEHHDWAEEALVDVKLSDVLTDEERTPLAERCRISSIRILVRVMKRAILRQAFRHLKFKSVEVAAAYSNSDR